MYKTDLPKGMGVVLISADLSNGELSMRVMYHLLIMTLQSEQVLTVIFKLYGPI